MGDSVLGRHSLLLHKNEPNQKTQFRKIYHIADNTNLLRPSKVIKKLSKIAIIDLKSLVNFPQNHLSRSFRIGHRDKESIQ